MRKKTQIDVDEVINTCAWCRKRMSLHTERFSLGARVKAKVDLIQHEGSILPIVLSKTSRTIMAIVPTHSSQAKKDGNDLLFTLCSQACGLKLKEKLQQELDMIERWN
jgi:hypothetical protein